MRSATPHRLADLYGHGADAKRLVCREYKFVVIGIQLRGMVRSMNLALGGLKCSPCSMAMHTCASC